MRLTLQLTVDAPDDVDQDQLQAAVAAAFDDVDDVSVTGRSVAHLDEEYRVVGTTRGKPDERLEVVVRAGSQEEAEAKAIEAEPKLAIAAALPVAPAPRAVDAEVADSEAPMRATDMPGERPA